MDGLQTAQWAAPARKQPIKRHNVIGGLHEIGHVAISVGIFLDIFGSFDLNVVAILAT